MDDFNKMVGEKLFALRKSKKMTRVDLGKKVKLHETTIKKYEDGKIKSLGTTKLQEFANALDTTVSYLMENNETITDEFDIKDAKNHIMRSLGIDVGTMMPVLGSVQAGVPVEAIRDIVGEIAVTKEMARSGEYFALKVRGNSMEPMLHDGFIVIVKRQSDVENGEVGVVIVNGSDATIKKVEKHEEGISLIPVNNEFKTQFYSNEKIKSMPVEVVGKVIEFRGVL